MRKHFKHPSKYLATNKKAVSSVITTIILTGILLGILIIASFVSMNVLGMQMANTEFEQAKSSMLLLDDIVQDVSLRSGAGSYVQFNEKTGGIGISQQNQNVLITATPGQTSLTLKPSAAGYYSQWDVIPLIDKFAATSDGKYTTYIYSNSPAKIETHKLEVPLPRTTAINYIIFNIRITATQNNKDNTAQVAVRVNNADYFGTAEKIRQNNFDIIQVKYYTNPNTNVAWQWSDLSSLEIGGKISTWVAGEARVSEFSATVDFTPPATVTNIRAGSFNLMELQYSGGSQASAAETVMQGASYCIVNPTQDFGYLRVDQDKGVTIKLNYNRVRVSAETLVDPHTNMVQITFVNITKGNWGGAGSVNLKVQNIQVNSEPHVLPSSSVSLNVQFGSTSAALSFNKFATDPNVLSTVVIFTEIRIQVSTA